MQDTQRGDALHLGENVLNRREGEYNMKVAATLRGLGELSSNKPEEIAQGLQALGDFQELVATRKGEPWTAEQRWSYLGLAAQIVISPNESEVSAGVKVWTPRQKQQFMDILVQKGVLPPELSALPSAPTIPPAVK